MKRLTLFSSFDPDNIIDDYVIYYLTELSKVSDIIFSADCKYSEEQISKLNGLTKYNIHDRHGEYDFGSYKKAYLKADELDILQDYDQIILANDSCYGPFYDLQKVFNKMDPKKVDFWGFSNNIVDITPHLQSYFIVINKEAFLSSEFREFLLSVKKEEIRKQVVFKYEHGLTRILTKAGFTHTAFFTEKNNKFIHDPSKKWDLMIKREFPFLKRTTFTRNSYKLTNLKKYKKVIHKKYPNYDITLIEKNLSRYELNIHDRTFNYFFKTTPLITLINFITLIIILLTIHKGCNTITDIISRVNNLSLTTAYIYWGSLLLCTYFIYNILKRYKLKKEVNFFFATLFLCCTFLFNDSNLMITPITLALQLMCIAFYNKYHKSDKSLFLLISGITLSLSILLQQYLSLLLLPLIIDIFRRKVKLKKQIRFYIGILIPLILTYFYSNLHNQSFNESFNNISDNWRLLNITDEIILRKTIYWKPIILYLKVFTPLLIMMFYFLNRRPYKEWFFLFSIFIVSLLGLYFLPFTNYILFIIAYSIIIIGKSIPKFNDKEKIPKPLYFISFWLLAVLIIESCF
ncbi:MAG: hypothetical protein HRT69_02265 [Flavobacteriaceae bacterium]|nr:hypothetical protein [Flavobacteriaceae bacterium]